VEKDHGSVQVSSVPVFMRKSVLREPRESISAEHKTPPDSRGCEEKRDSRLSVQKSLSSWELGDIEIRLNEKLIKGSQSSDQKVKFRAFRDALQELIQANPESSSLLTKIANGIDAWGISLETALFKRRMNSETYEQMTNTNSRLIDEISKLKEKVAFLGKENAKLTRKFAEATNGSSFPGPQSHVSDLIKSLQEEVSIHRKREELLMTIINKMREKGYPVGDLQKSPRSSGHTDKILSDESTRNSASETDPMKCSQSGFLSDIASFECREEDCDMAYSPTPCGFDAEESVHMLPSEDRPAVPRLTLPSTGDIGHKGVDLRMLKSHTQNSP
jgi:hypothetical protein